MKIGQPVFVKNITNGETEETTINYVGKKYFKVEGRGYLFNKKTFHNKPQKKEFISKYRCYLSLEEIDLEREYKLLTQFIGENIFSSELSIDQLRQISKVISKK
jgi:hypothetical protein